MSSTSLFIIVIQDALSTAEAAYVQGQGFNTIHYGGFTMWCKVVTEDTLSVYQDALDLLGYNYSVKEAKWSLESSSEHIE